MKRLLPILLLAAGAAAPAAEPRLAADKPAGRPELVATFDGPMSFRVSIRFCMATTSSCI